MGQWGFKSYEEDEAADALDAAFERVHAQRYEQLMDDRNPMSVDQVQRELANPETLRAAVEVLQEEHGADLDAWDDEIARLAFAGVVVRHAELGVAVPDDLRRRAVDWLERETIEWDDDHDADRRRRFREREIEMLSRPGPSQA